MKTLEELKKAVDQLSHEERIELRTYIDNLPLPPHPLPKEERIRRLDEWAKSLRESLTEEELDEMVRAMNEDYIEEVDDSTWED